MAGTAATLLVRKWESPPLVSVANDTLRRIVDNAKAMAVVEDTGTYRLFVIRPLPCASK